MHSIKQKNYVRDEKKNFFLTELKRPSVNDFCLKERVATIYLCI